MSNAVFYVEYKLKKGASVPDFLLAAEKLNDEYMSQQKGYISWQQLVDGDTWADVLTFETMEDAENVENASPNDIAKKFYSYINLNSCKQHFYSIERSYKQ
ncbi:MAG: hypothetical protein FWH05_00595 [Oscillospiraceae bacterium]|nr:hypothetical protein [Oscillospiraceae bacterium]